MFNPAEIGKMQLPNRFVRSATAEFAANPDGTIISEYLKLYSDLAKGEVGLIIQGHLYIMDEGKAHKKMAGIAHDHHREGLKQIVQSVHSIGTDSKIVAQLNHGGAHSFSKKAPSKRDDKETVVMTEQDIEDLIINFGNAAKRAKKVGYDAIQIHAAHGYLLSQFLSNKTNKRTDQWGGSLENRYQILLSIYQKIRSEVGSDFPLLVKMNSSDEPNVGFPVEEAAQISKLLANEGLDALELSGMKTTRTKFDNEAYYSKNARIIKQTIGDMPLAVVGGFRSMKVIKKLHQEFADFVSMCRPFIREPDLVIKFRNGKQKADCISCNKCFKAPSIITCLDKID